jgi:hypothetical protein
MPDRARVVSNVLGLVGGLVGGYVGYHLFFWITRQGFYALILPGALLGLGCGALARHHSTARGVVCAAAALALGIYTAWTFEPFRENQSFSYYLSHLHQLPPVTMMMLGVGAVVAFWTGKDSGYGGLGGGGKPTVRHGD